MEEGSARSEIEEEEEDKRQPVFVGLETRNTDPSERAPRGPKQAEGNS